MRRVALLALTLASLSCASFRAPCAPTGAEYEGLTVYRACAVDLQARPTIASSVVPFDPPDPRRCYRATFELIIDPAGNFILSSARPIRVNDSTFYKAAITSLTQERWEPARKGDHAVPQLVRVNRRVAPARARNC